jgi:Family of unknown function (DUF6519)
MATDVARLSFEAARCYTGVVPQQGRVNLEAEQNEQRVIDGEERRKELLDIIGPAATPDDGYAVTPSGAGFVVSAGVMYVGGLRVELDADLDFDAQPDWLDRPPLQQRPDLGHVVLVVIERDVTAVEDPMLYEPALGGPDGAARTRLLQRVELLPTGARTCDAALPYDQKLWETVGLSYDPLTAELNSNSRLLVSLEGPSEAPNPCEPTALGGYLGAENQLIRVQITDVDTDGSISFLWGYDDASMLYRVTPDASANPVLTLNRSPVDDYHRPRAGQAVQVLRSAAELQSTDGVIEGYVAALDGRAAVLTAPYDPDTKTVQFPAALPAEYLDAAQTPQLYLRVWENLVTGVTLDTAVSLDGTGLQVTFSLDGGDVPHVGDYWCIAARPATPTTVYPDRLLRTPQPPDGPRMWACPLAVIEYGKETVIVLDDCRHHFGPVTDGCEDCWCTIDVSPSDAPRLQEIIDKAAGQRVTLKNAQPAQRGRIIVCFAAGQYALPAPLVLRKAHSGMVFQACGDGVVLAPLASHEEQFRYGLLILAETDDISISGIDFDLPQAAVAQRFSGPSGARLKRGMLMALNELASRRFVSVAIRAVNATDLEVSDCTFHFNIGESRLTIEEQADLPRNVFGVGILASGTASGHRLTRNTFRHPEVAPIDDAGIARLMVGYLIAPVATPQPAAGEPVIVETGTRELKTETSAGGSINLGTSLMPAVLAEAEFTKNTFDGITVPVIAVASLGRIRVTTNAVANCYGGFWLLDASTVANTDLFGQYTLSNDTQDLTMQRRLLAAGLIDPVLLAILLVAETIPLPPLQDFTPAGISVFKSADLKQMFAAAGKRQQAGMAALIEALQKENPAPQQEPEANKPAARTRRGAKAESAVLSFNPPAERDVDASFVTAEDAAGKAWEGLNELHMLLREEREELALWVTDNDIFSTTTIAKETSGPALVVFDLALFDRRIGFDTAIIANNRIRAQRSAVAAAVVGLTACTVTGNIVANAMDDSVRALALLLVDQPAITGNVVVGYALLPTGRPFAAPLDTWLPLNTVQA